VPGSPASRAGFGRRNFRPHEAKKCNNFRLARSGKLTASCMSTRAATHYLLLTGIHRFLAPLFTSIANLFGNLNPSLIAMIQLKPGISARVTK